MADSLITTPLVNANVNATSTLANITSAQSLLHVSAHDDRADSIMERAAESLKRIKLDEDEATRIALIPGAKVSGYSHWVGPEKNRKQYRHLGNDSTPAICCQLIHEEPRAHAVLLCVRYLVADKRSGKLLAPPTPANVEIQYLDASPFHYRDLKDLRSEEPGFDLFDHDLLMAKIRGRYSFKARGKAYWKSDPAVVAHVEAQVARWKPKLESQLGKLLTAAQWKILSGGPQEVDSMPTLDDLEDITPSPSTRQAAVPVSGVVRQFTEADLLE